jgi:hypothetical protein
MDTLFLRTPLGETEISDRRHGLDRWQRTVLIVIGKGKTLRELHHELRQIPETLETMLHALLEKGLVELASGALPERLSSPVQTTPLKEAKRYLTYLIGIIENADAAAALSLTIALKKVSAWEDMTIMQSILRDRLHAVCGADEAERLLEKLAIPVAALPQ